VFGIFTCPEFHYFAWGENFFIYPLQYRAGYATIS
jgi:hypothetical protein